jgi:hypothetical protein
MLARRWIAAWVMDVEEDGIPIADLPQLRPAVRDRP